NIVTLKDVGVERGELYLAMELVEGPTLSSMLRGLRAKQQPLQLTAALEVLLQVSDALDYTHRLADIDGHPLRLVHRDVSPQNILVDCTGVAKLADFGIARSAGQSTRTRTGMLKGKINYMAPEQIRGEAYDHRVDLWALGVVLYEMLSGVRMYDGA